MKSHKRHYLVRAALLAGVCTFAVSGAAYAQSQHHFDIPAEPASDALQAFAQQAGKRVLFSYDAVQGKQTPAVSGLLSDDAALKILINSAGLEVAKDDGQTIALTPRKADAAKAQASATPKDDAIVEITVTANRTESAASKTPVTLTAITGEKLAAAGITNPTQLADVVPNLMIDRGNANGLQINIRGVTSTGTQAPSAAFLLDGIYIADQNAQEVALYDIDRVETLRGPQGTLYGRNTTAGVVDIITVAPKKTLGGSLDVGYGNYGATQVTGVLNLPVNDKLAVRIAGNYDARDSYYKQDVPQAYKEPKDKDDKSIRVSVLYKPTDSLRWLVKADYNAMSGVGNGFGIDPLISNFYKVPLTVPTGDTREPDPVYLNPSASQALAKRYADIAPFHSNDYTYGLSSELNWTLNTDWNFTWLAGYRQFKRDDSGDVFWGADYSGATPVETEEDSNTGEVAESQSQEFRLAYDDGKLKAQAGLYYFQENSRTNLWFNNFGLPNYLTRDLSLGEFAQATYALTDRWRVTAGVRYTRDDVYQAGGALLALPFGTLTLSNTVDKGHSGKVTWKVGSDYDLGPKTLAYVSIATGYKALNFNATCNNTTVECVVQPENLTDYEAGIKSRLMDNRLMLTGAVFHYDYSNLQVGQIVSQVIGGVSTPSEITANAGAAKVDGLELEGTYIPAANNRLDFSATWENARYTNYVISTADPASGTYTGDPLDHAPDLTLSAGYTYTQPLANGGQLVANLHSKYSDKYAIINTSLQAQFWQPAYTTTDVSLRYNAPSDRWYVEGYVRNIEDKIAVTYVNTSPGWPTLNDGTVNTSDPRTYGVRLGAKF